MGASPCQGPGCPPNMLQHLWLAPPCVSLWCAGAGGEEIQWLPIPRAKCFLRAGRKPSGKCSLEFQQARGLPVATSPSSWPAGPAGRAALRGLGQEDPLESMSPSVTDHQTGRHGPPDDGHRQDWNRAALFGFSRSLRGRRLNDCCTQEGSGQGRGPHAPPSATAATLTLLAGPIHRAGGPSPSPGCSRPLPKPQP